MAGVVDILLKIVGDSRDAVRAVDDVGTAAERTTEKVSRSQRIIRDWAAVVASVAGTTGAVFAGVAEAARQIDDLTGLGKAPDLGLATSGRDTAAGLMGAGRLGASDVWRTAAGVEVLSRTLGIDLPWGGRATSRKQIQAAIEQLAATNPAQLESALPFLEGDAAAAARETLARQTAAAAYRQQLAGPTVVNVNTGVGDRNQIGREVRAALDARDRNNGRYVQTNTRR